MLSSSRVCSIFCWSPSNRCSISQTVQCPSEHVETVRTVRAHVVDRSIIIELLGLTTHQKQPIVPPDSILHQRQCSANLFQCFNLQDSASGEMPRPYKRRRTRSKLASL